MFIKLATGMLLGCWAHWHEMGIILLMNNIGAIRISCLSLMSLLFCQNMYAARLHYIMCMYCIYLNVLEGIRSVSSQCTQSTLL